MSGNNDLRYEQTELPVSPDSMAMKPASIKVITKDEKITTKSTKPKSKNSSPEKVSTNMKEGTEKDTITDYASEEDKVSG